MREFYVLGVVEKMGDAHSWNNVFRMLSVHVSRNKAFKTAREIIEALNKQYAPQDHSDMRMYEHEAGDPMVVSHFYLIRTKAGEIHKDVQEGGGTREDKSIRVLEYETGMTREHTSHVPNDEAITAIRTTGQATSDTGSEGTMD